MPNRRKGNSSAKKKGGGKKKSKKQQQRAEAENSHRAEETIRKELERRRQQQQQQQQQQHDQAQNVDSLTESFEEIKSVHNQTAKSLEELKSELDRLELGTAAEDVKEKDDRETVSRQGDPEGKPKSHTVGDLSGGWFGDDDYAAASSEGDVSEERNSVTEGSESDADDESLWELRAHLPLTTDRTCDTCGRRAVAVWEEHGAKGNFIAQCLTCQSIRFMQSYFDPKERIQTEAPSDLDGLLFADVSDFDLRSIGNTPVCIQCGDVIKPKAREETMVVLRPCCGNMICVDCAKPLKDGFGRSEVRNLCLLR